MARGGLAPLASLPAARGRPPAPPCGVNRRERRRGGCAGSRLRGGHWGERNNPQPRSRIKSRPRPRPRGGHAAVAVRGWPIWGTRGGVRKRRACRRGAGAHAAAEGDRVPTPPVPPPAVAPDPAADSPTRWRGWSEVGTGSESCEMGERSAPVDYGSYRDVRGGWRPPAPPRLGGTRRCAATEAARPTTRPRRLRPRARSRAASAHPAAAGAPGPGAGRASCGRANGGRRGPAGGQRRAGGRAWAAAASALRRSPARPRRSAAVARSSPP